MSSQYRRLYRDSMPLDSEEAPGGVIVYYADGDEEIIHVNKYIVDLFECETVDEFLDLVNGSFRSFVHGEDINAAEDSIWGQVEKHSNLDHINYRIKTRTGKLVNVEDFGRLVEIDNGRPLFYVFIVKVGQRSAVDLLTGLPSMMRFHELAEMGAQTIRRRGGTPVAVALDLVGMKAFNTQYGRDGGDNLLCVFADLLRKYFGSEACSRFSEDHFYAFAQYDGIDELIEALFADFRVANDGNVLPIRGGAYVCDPEDDIVAVGFDRAKIACDLDRKTWESHLLWFNDELRAREQLRIHVLGSVDRAIAQGWIRPYYQCIVRSATGYICGEEALARWVDPEFGLLQPGQFVPLLEEAGLLHKVDMHIVDCVLQDLKTKREHGVPIVPVSVNISLRDLGKLDIAETILQRVDESGIERSLLRIEFVESAVSDDPVLFREQVKTLRDAGIEVWMDDFGSGYSSLNTMREFDFDLIKLDMDFIHDLRSQKARDIVSGVVHMATKLGMGILSEGVETQEQALFMESIGCDMLQGYFFVKPQPLEYILNKHDTPREDIHEAAYWNAVGAVDLIDPFANVETRAVDGSPLASFPTGVMERRDGVWRVLRGNDAYRDFLMRAGVLAFDKSRLHIAETERHVDVEFEDAVERSRVSGMWERVAGRMEHGTGLQFYVRPMASMDGAESFVLTSVPTMLGTVLGSYGDVPVAYAVLKVRLNEAGDEVLDAEYVHANPLYCEWCNYNPETLIGSSFNVLSGSAAHIWLPYCYEATVLKRHVSDVLYSDEIGHWLSFTMAPSPVDGCCVYAFTIADDARRERAEIMMSRDTAELVIGITNIFNAESNYRIAMNKVFAMMSRIIHPERLYMFERGREYTRVAFEWCADGVEPQKEKLQRMKNSAFEVWERLFEENSVIVIQDMEEIRDLDLRFYNAMKKRGIERILAAPMISDGRLIGFLAADNYVLEEGFDTRSLLENVASFISGRTASQRLMEELERAGSHDVLTGLLNRRGFDDAIAERMAALGDGPFMVALIDIDDFKTVNDLYGHSVGDSALRALAREISDALPNGAVLGRNGGDEFVAMTFGDDVEATPAAFAELEARKLGCEHEGVWYALSISIGFACCPGEAVDLQDAYVKADTALYSVKLTGKHGARRYTPDLESQYRSQLGFTPRDISENVPGAILVHRAGDNSEILFANDELVEMFECDSLADFMEYTGGTFAGMVHPDDAERVYAELVSQVDIDDIGGKNFSDYRILTKRGNVRNVADNGRLVDIDKVGRVFYVLIVDRDERSMR